jgi:hypothetical protein
MIAAYGLYAFSMLYILVGKAMRMNVCLSA